MDYLNDLYEAQELVACSLEEAIKKTKQQSGGKLMTTSDSEHFRNLMSAFKNSQVAIAMIEEKEGGESYAMDDIIERGRDSRRSYRAYDDGMNYGMSGRRGRNPSTGRYMSRTGGYSGHGDYMEMVEEAMQRDPEGTRRKLEMLMQQ